MTPLRFSFVAAFSLMALTVAALTSGGAGRAFPAPLATPQGGAGLSSRTIGPSPVIGAIQTSADNPTSWRASASREDLQRAQLCLTAAIYYEAASESEAGQRAVAQVVLNRARHPAWPATICGVVYQASDMPICQFSYSCDGSMARRPDRAGWDQAARIAGEALSGEVYRPVGLSTFYHTLSVDPRWNRAMIPTIVIGQHIFYRLPGRAGTEAAFDQRYTGGEPLPGPLPRRLTPKASPQLDHMRPNRSPLPAETVLASSSSFRRTDTSLIPDGAVLPQYRDSGRWIGDE